VADLYTMLPSLNNAPLMKVVSVFRQVTPCGTQAISQSNPVCLSLFAGTESAFLFESHNANYN